jgi:hypothetical protein
MPIVKRFSPHLEVLPPAQRAFWDLAHQVPKTFVLYGGTALALRLGHRQSLDFDFFSPEPFSPRDLQQAVPILTGCQEHQSKPNTLTVTLRQPAAVTVSFFGGLTLARVGDPELTEDGQSLVASLRDLAATKLAVLPQRAEAKDYLDVAALLQHGMELEDLLGCAQAVYGGRFNAMLCLKALSYFADGNLPALPAGIRKLLADTAAAVSEIPNIRPVSARLTPGE